MNFLARVWAVTLFELRRTMTVSRASVWLVLALFPVLVVGSLRYTGATPPHPDIWLFLLYALIVEVTTSLGMLLWMAPAVQSELEGKTWIYLAVRPYGRRVVLFGKYVTALTWSFAASLVALTITVPLVHPPQPGRAFVVLLVLALISALGRGAAYSIFAVALPQRAMVFAVAYTLIFEYLVGMIPAVVNQITVQFHMRCLLIRWLQLTSLPSGLRLFFDEAPSWRHLLALAIYLTITGGVSILLLDWREFVSSEEG